MTKAKKIVAQGLLTGTVLLGAAEIPVIPDHTYYVQTRPVTESRPSLVYNISTQGKKEAKEIGRACYNEFYAKGKTTIREKIECDEYWKFSKVKNYPAPHKDGYSWHAYDTILYDTPSGELEDGYFYIAEKNYRALLEPKKANAAIAYDTSANGGSANGVCSDTWSHTVSGTDTIIIMGSFVEDASSADRQVNSADFNGDALAAGIETDALSTNVSLWYLKNPDTGAHTMSVVWCTTGSLSAGGGMSLSYTGVDQTSPIDATSGTSYGNDSTPSHSVNTVADNSWVIGFLLVNIGTAFADPASSQTQRQEVDSSGFASANLADTNGPKTPAGSVTMDWTCTGASCTSIDGTISLMSLKPAAAGGGGSSTPATLYYIEVD